jgi:prepilin-type N-terminal cleavage/methylation domain-containing protein/prepilin-type processing-associated H-X9-DG protein
MNARRALTLVELLCVLAIILLLIALLMPSLKSSRSLSTRLICSTHMRMYGQMGQSYLDGNDNTFPDAHEWLYSPASDAESHPIGCRWHDRAMAPDGEIVNKSPEYMGKMLAFLGGMPISPCPTFRDIARKMSCENPRHRKDIDIDPQYSYTMNAYLGTEFAGGVLKVYQARSPGLVFFFAEENCWSLPYATRTLPAALSTKALDDTALTVSCTAEPLDCFATYHNASGEDMDDGFGNAVFLDGHVDSIKAQNQLRGAFRSRDSNPGGNLFWAWAQKTPPEAGWEAQR